MEIEFKWSVEKVQVVENNLIASVDLIVTAIDKANNLTTSANYSCNLIRSDSFIPYEQLTEQQVLDWCFEPIITTLDGQTSARLIKDEGETQVTNQIVLQLAQKQFQPALPWIQVPA